MIINKEIIGIDDTNLNKTYINSRALELKKSDILFYDGPESYSIYKARNREPLANQLLVFCGTDERSVMLLWGALENKRENKPLRETRQLTRL